MQGSNLRFWRLAVATSHFKVRCSLFYNVAALYRELLAGIAISVTKQFSLDRPGRCAVG